MLIRGHVGGDPALVDERLVETRRLAVGEHVRRHIQLRVVLRKHRRRVPAQIDARQLDAIFEQQVGAVGQCCRRADRRDGRSRREAAEVFLRQLERLRRFEITGQRQRRVRRMVVGLEKIADLVE